MSNWPRQSWVDAEPRRFELEKRAMAAVAPELAWVDVDGRTGWEGDAPVWPFDRPPPSGLGSFLEGRRLRLRVDYVEAFPMAAPRLWPLDPVPDPRYRSQHIWHVNPNGSLCLMQSAADWTGMETAADLVVKAAGWFLEYLLMEAERIEAMTVSGIANDTSLDHLLDPATDLSAGSAQEPS